MRNLAGFIVCTAITLIAVHFNQALFAVPFGIGGLAFFVLALKANQKAAAEGSARIKETDAQLRTEVVATLKLAFTKLSGADDATKNKVADLLAEAGKHLGNPYTNSRVVYGSDYFVNWNKEGLALVAQAKQAIDGHVASSQPRA